MSQYSQELPSCASIIWQVLGEAPGDYTEPAKVRSKLQELREFYWSWSTPVEERKIPNFSDPDERKAYVYRYVPCNMNLTCCALQQCLEFKDQVRYLALKSERRSMLKVACIGGGPGSDMLGVIRFLQENFHSRERPEIVSIKNFDKCAFWDDTWSSILEDAVGGLHASFAQLDVTSEESIKHVAQNSQFEKFDLFTIVRFLSELKLQDLDAKGFFRAVINKAKSGSFFLLIDNCNPSNHLDTSTFWLCDLAKEFHLELVQPHWDDDSFPDDVFSTADKESIFFTAWKEALNEQVPQQKLRCLVRMWRKP